MVLFVPVLYAIGGQLVRIASQALLKQAIKAGAKRATANMIKKAGTKGIVNATAKNIAQFGRSGGPKVRNPRGIGTAKPIAAPAGTRTVKKGDNVAASPRVKAKPKKGDNVAASPRVKAKPKKGDNVAASPRVKAKPKKGDNVAASPRVKAKPKKGDNVSLSPKQKAENAKFIARIAKGDNINLSPRMYKQLNRQQLLPYATPRTKVAPKPVGKDPLIVGSGLGLLGVGLALNDKDKKPDSTTGSRTVKTREGKDSVPKPTKAKKGDNVGAIPATGPSKDEAFGKAFKRNRSNRQATFTYKDKLYTTRIKEETIADHKKKFKVKGDYK